MKMLTMYSKPGCGFCMKAAEFMTEKGIPFSIVDITEIPAAKQRMKAAGHKTVPQLYLGDTLAVAGGCQGLLAADLDALRLLMS